ncbi:MAG: rkpH kpsC lipA [Solimicrobium sp.]|jgi:capsular polysaccharide export protein|nr:rkpH kpsC lipA [Solimicrobium sp.]
MNHIDMPDTLYAYQFSYWKRPIIKQCFPKSTVYFIERTNVLPSACTLVLWGMSNLPADVHENVQIVRIEDGFLRSVGLGADLIRPMSWVIDKIGIYFDATRLSGLEELLTLGNFDSALTNRAANLRSRIVAAGLTKYNVGANPWKRPLGANQVILVAGQVENDASLAYGAPGEKTNIGLLKAVRSANPDAYVIYKPHPDVYARLRAEGQNEQDAYRWCDEVVINSPMGDLLMAVDEVHLLTSLTGFEALLRGKRVTCYGQPFYAGWGLTTDIIPVTRRLRRLTLDELVAGVLIKYPIYLSRNGKELISPEQALDELVSWRYRVKDGTPWWRELIRFFLRRI